MINLFSPGPHQRTEQVIRVPYRVEQHEEEQNQEDPKLQREIPQPHDPFWSRRFWSIQHVHDCIEGKTFHWFWSPLGEAFNLAQLMFIILPFAAYANDRGTNIGIRGLILMAISVQLAASVSKYLYRWYRDWRFTHIKYRVIRH